MKSFSLGRFLGIHIKVHASFLIMAGIVGALQTISYGLIAGFMSLIYIIFFFGFVLLHELGHCIVARYYNIHVGDITLWFLGGIAKMADTTRKPNTEIKIAAAGPFVNLLLAIILSPIAVSTHILLKSNFFTHLVFANVALMMFNLLPAFPLDGGRILRAWYSKKVGYFYATQKACHIGMISAAIMAIIGIFIDPILLFVAFFIYIGAQEERRMVEMQYNNDYKGRPFYFFFHSSQTNNSFYDRF